MYYNFFLSTDKVGVDKVESEWNIGRHYMNKLKLVVY